MILVYLGDFVNILSIEKNAINSNANNKLMYNVHPQWYKQMSANEN